MYKYERRTCSFLSLIRIVIEYIKRCPIGEKEKKRISSQDKHRRNSYIFDTYIRLRPKKFDVWRLIWILEISIRIDQVRHVSFLKSKVISHSQHRSKSIVLILQIWQLSFYINISIEEKKDLIHDNLDIEYMRTSRKPGETFTNMWRLKIRFNEERYFFSKWVIPLKYDTKARSTCKSKKWKDYVLKSWCNVYIL